MLTVGAAGGRSDSAPAGSAVSGGGHGAVTRPGERVVGPLDRVAPEAKILGLVAFLVISAITPSGRYAMLAADGVIVLTLAAVATVAPRALLRRLVLDVPLVVLALTYAVAGRGPRTHVLGLSVSAAGLPVGVTALAKATIGIVAVSALAASTSVAETVTGLHRLGLPGWFVDLVALAARQATVLGADVERLRLAASVRLAGRGRRAEAAAVARALGASFVHATERVDRLQLAAQARGGTTLGTLVRPAPSASATRGAWVVAGLPAVAALAARLTL